MRISGSTTYQYSEHLQQVEALLDPIRYDRGIDDAERRRLVDEVLATANARALTLRTSRQQPVETAPMTAHDLEAQRWQWGLARVG
jgi:hypothetical protein